VPLRFKTASETSVVALPSVVALAFLAALATPLFAGAQQGDPASAAANAADEAPPFRPCSLEQMQSRKSLSRQPDISGVATPLLIHLTAPIGATRRVHNGEVISFSSRNGEAPPQGAPPWLLEILDPAGRPAAEAATLSDGNMIRVRTSGANPRPDKDPPLVIVKADVPDQNRPTTCDAQIRDGDFVFIHTLSPSVWLNAAPATAASVPSAETMPHSVLVNGSKDPSCVQDSETCVTDKGGGLVCAWAPSCAR
jgi:hypothetical protein